MKIRIPTATLPPEKYRSVEIAGDVAEQLALYHRLLSQEAQKNGGGEVPLEYVVKEMLREACKADPERVRIKPRPASTRLRNIEVEGDVAQAVRDYTKKLGLEDPSYVIESLLGVFLRRDREFQQLVREMDERGNGDEGKPAGPERTLATAAPRTPVTA